MNDKFGGCKKSFFMVRSESKQKDGCVWQRWSEYNTNLLEYEYDYFEHAWVQVRVLRKQMYSSTITLQCTQVRVRLL